MSSIKPLKIFWIVGSSYFTVISSLMYAVSLVNPDQVINANRFLLILLFSFIMGLGTALYWGCGFNKILAFCLHAGVYNLGFALFLWLSGQEFASVVVGTLIFAAIYTVSTVVVRLLYKTFRTKKNEAADDTPPTLKRQNSPSKDKKSEAKSSTEKSETKKAPKTAKEEYKNLFS